MTTIAAQAARIAITDREAEELVARVREGVVDAPALAIAVAPLYGVNLQAFARAVVKAFAEQRGAA